MASPATDRAGLVRGGEREVADAIEVLDRRYQGHFMARDYVTIREEERDGETVWTFTSVAHDRLKSAPAKVTKQGDSYSIMGAAWGAPIAGVEVRIDDGEWQPATLTEARAASLPGCSGRLTGDARHWASTRHLAGHRGDGEVQPAPDDPLLAAKQTFWESNGQITRRVRIA